METRSSANICLRVMVTPSMRTFGKHVPRVGARVGMSRSTSVRARGWSATSRSGMGFGPQRFKCSLRSGSRAILVTAFLSKSWRMCMTSSLRDGREVDIVWIRNGAGK